MAAPAARALASAASTRAAATLRSVLYSMASATSFSSSGSWKRPSQPSPTGPASVGAPVHLSGSFVWGSDSWNKSAAGGGSRTTQPATIAAIAPAARPRTALPMSVQLRDQVIDLGADAHDHLAEDVDHLEALGVDRRIPLRARGQ